ncbi:MAG: hypothetical protein ACXVPQ_09990 [Bacteroidia bacterium]
MEARTKVKLQSLEPYRYLFPKARLIDHTVKRGATVADTVKTIPKIIRITAWQVQRYVDQELRGLPNDEAFRKLWNFVKYHIEYVPDEKRVEQVRSPRRLIHDAKGDCDCGTTFIGACLYLLEIPFLFRITKYKENYFQHIYPVITLPGEKEIIMDFVVHAFNYEEPYTEKQDTKMDLQFLDGIDEAPILGVDARNARQRFGYESDLAELGRLLKKKTPAQKQAAKEKRKNFGKKLMKVVNIANKVNPGAVLLRAGILASMKLNLMRVAETLKWGYASRELAQSKGMDMSKYDKLKAVLAKAQKIFYASGGKEDNLRKAILTGRGNRHHEVAGLAGMNENTPLPQLLGAIYDEEFVHGMEDYPGANGLGVVSETAAIATATSAMGALAALLKSIGSLFPHKKDKVSDPVPPDSGADSGGGNDADESEGEEHAPASNADETPATPMAESEQQDTPEAPAPGEDNGDNLPAPTNETALTTTGDNDPPPDSDPPGDETTQGLGGIMDFYERNKQWILPTGIAIGAFGLVALVHHFVSKPELPPPVLQTQTINGAPRRSKKKGGKKKSENERQSVIALM